MRFRPVLLLPMILFGCGSGNSSTGSTSQQSSRVDQITIAKMEFSVPASV
jgi:hypothetical protein